MSDLTLKRVREMEKQSPVVGGIIHLDELSTALRMLRERMEREQEFYAVGAKVFRGAVQICHASHETNPHSPAMAQRIADALNAAEDK